MASTQATRAARASSIGTMLEWYDFGIYGTAAALVLNEQFFPRLDPVAGTLAAFATFAVGFLARPVGGVVFGILGDRHGRRNTLIWALTITGGVTVAIGLLPTYETIGVAAPILLVLLRLLQGIGVGGEWGGAVLLSTEHAPPGRRSFYGGLMQMGVPLGVALSTGVFLLVAVFVPADVFSAWGWRIPFLASIVLLGVGLWIRLKVEETPEFTAAARTTRPTHPLRTTLVDRGQAVVLGIGLIVGTSALGYLYITYVLSYGQQMRYSNVEMLGSLVAGALTWAATAPLWAAIGDRPGGLRGLFIWGGVARTLAVWPFFLLLQTQDTALLYVAMIVMGAVVSSTQVPSGVAIAQMFPARSRYTGTSLTYQLGNVLGGGIAPFVAAALAGTAGGIGAVVIYMCAVSLVSVAAAFFVLRDGSPAFARASAPAGAVVPESA